jgi:hypothetical protein
VFVPVPVGTIDVRPVPVRLRIASPCQGWVKVHVETLVVVPEDMTAAGRFPVDEAKGAEFEVP